MKVFGTTDFSRIKNEIKAEKANLVIIDSIQTIQSELFNSKAGPNQIKEITFDLMEMAKEMNIVIIVIGHITKDGSVAGPKTLEHMVDTVLYFGGEATKEIRTLSIRKNRFGPIHKTCLFRMNQNGLEEVISNKLDRDLESHSECGFSYGICAKDDKIIFNEVEALVIKSHFVSGKRISEGIENLRLNILIALIEKYLKISLSNYDIYLKVKGIETHKSKDLDLAIINAILSSYLNKPIPSCSLFMGEVSLSGKLAKPTHEVLARDAIHLNNFKSVYSHKSQFNKEEKMECSNIEVKSISEIIDKVFL